MLMKNMLILFINVFLIETIFPQTLLISQQKEPTSKIPVIESRSAGNNDFYIIFLTGNGGWRNLAKYVTSYLNSKNVSVLAINTKKYLLSEKKPDQIACDLESLVDRYNNKWGEDRVVFIGYSMGAEVLPFAVNRMGSKYINELEDMILIGPWQKATFKVKLADYFYEVNKGDDIYGELLKMKLKKSYVICDDNEYSICAKGLEGVIDHKQIGGGHHFGGDYNSLAKLIGKRLDLE
jgi:type IV secretory pathway VirJ component